MILRRGFVAVVMAFFLVACQPVTREAKGPLCMNCSSYLDPDKPVDEEERKPTFLDYLMFSLVIAGLVIGGNAALQSAIQPSR